MEADRLAAIFYLCRGPSLSPIEYGQKTMTSQHPRSQPPQRRYLLSGIVLLLLLIGSWTLYRWTTPNVLVAAVATATIQINLPTIEYPTIPASAPEFTVTLNSLEASGVTGTATFKDIAGTVAILLKVEGVSTAEEEESEESLVPAELHFGTCAVPGELAYAMSAPDAGQSETDLSINLEQLNAQKPMAVFLYRSPQDHTAIACGDVQ